MFFPIFFYLIISCSICGSEGQENGSENQLFIRQPIFPAENFMNASSTFDYIRAAEGLLRILETEEKFNEKVKETFGKEIKENRKKLEEF